MSVLEERFALMRQPNRCGFIPFVVAGDPDLPVTREILRELSRLEPIAIEVGVPFSDPTADGPVIQRAAQRAIKLGTTLSAVLQMLREARRDELAPLVLFTYYNPILQFGVEKFARQLRTCGVAAVLIVDLPPEASAQVRQHLRAAGIDLILLVAPTTSEARLKRIAKLARGFVYAVARTGVTGSAPAAADESRQLVKRLRSLTDIPVAVGFGIATGAQAKQVAEYADAFVVGSRLVSEIEKATAMKSATARSVLAAVRRCAKEFSIKRA